MMKNDKEEYKGKIIELVNLIKEESVLRRIYLITVSYTHLTLPTN